VGRLLAARRPLRARSSAERPPTASSASSAPRPACRASIQGIQTAIFTGLGPALESFVDGFTRWVEAHMQQIVDFVSSVANFVIGVIGGLFGIDFSAKTAEQSTEALAGAGEHAGKAFDGLARSRPARRPTARTR
jgi:hypothetical protein